jgi:hypothetical protein
LLISERCTIWGYKRLRVFSAFCLRLIVMKKEKKSWKWSFNFWWFFCCLGNPTGKLVFTWWVILKTSTYVINLCTRLKLFWVHQLGSIRDHTFGYKLKSKIVNKLISNFREPFWNIPLFTSWYHNLMSF